MKCRFNKRLTPPEILFSVFTGWERFIMAHIDEAQHTVCEKTTSLRCRISRKPTNSISSCIRMKRIWTHILRTHDVIAFSSSKSLMVISFRFENAIWKIKEKGILNNRDKYWKDEIESHAENIFQSLFTDVSSVITFYNSNAHRTKKPFQIIVPIQDPFFYYRNLLLKEVIFDSIYRSSNSIQRLYYENIG